MGHFGWVRLVRVSLIVACRRLECIKGRNLDLLALIVVLSLSLPLLNRRCHLDTCLLKEFSQSALVKTFVHFDVSSREDPGPREEAHFSISARQKEPSVFVLASDAASHLVVATGYVPSVGSLDSLGVFNSIATRRVVADFDDVMTVQVWCSLCEETRRCPSVGRQVDEASVLAEVHRC